MDAFQTEVWEKHPSLFRWALSLTYDRARAEDLANETVLLALEHRDQFREGTNLAAWLFTILRNTFISEARRSKHQTRYLREAVWSREAILPSQIAKIQYREVLELVEKLPDEMRTVIIAIGFESKSYEEVAIVLGVPIGTVRSRLSRARKKLRQSLGEVVDTEKYSPRPRQKSKRAGARLPRERVEVVTEKPKATIRAVEPPQPPPVPIPASKKKEKVTYLWGSKAWNWRNKN